MSERITQAELARRSGLTPGRISQLKRQGLPVGDDRLLNLAEALAWMKRELNPARRQAAKAEVAPPPAPVTTEAAPRRRPPGPEPAPDADPAEGELGDLTEARTLHEWRKVEKLELELARDRGDLVPLADVQSALFGFTRLHRDRWQGWAAGAVIGMAARLGIEPAALFAELDKGVREHLAELAALPAPRVGGDHAGRA